MGTDTETTLHEIKQTISGFVEERDWLQYHDPKNLVMALMSEVGELADQFRWVNNSESHALAASPDHAEEVADELADIMMFAIEFASVCNIDISTAIASKLKKNAVRYPIDKAKGSCKKYDRL
ncbi:MAG TPA: NTP pyrophosphohydrolase [Rhodopirellula sp.]|nr:NTP pyrophosphohydrolase [Rhodopirellula sp.]